MPRALLLVALLAPAAASAETHRSKPTTVVAKVPKPLLPASAAGAGVGVLVGDLTWPEAEKVLTADRVIVLPLGAGAKEHGPHLLLRNDAILADYLARALLAARPVALLPELPYAFYPSFLEYPGSVSLSFDTQRDMVAEICRSIAGYGPRRFYVLNTGVSTARPLAATAEALAREGILLRFTDILAALKPVEDSVRQQAYGSHADEIETSMILYMEPAAVRMERAVADGGVVRPGPLTRDPANTDGHYSPSGVFGDPTLATRQKGERLTAGLLDAILKDIDGLARAPLPAGRPRSPLDAAPSP